MHELGTVLYVIRAVEDVCRENDLKTVRSVTLEIGEVSGILPEFLTDCWEWARMKSEYLKDAELKHEMIDAVTVCLDCGEHYPTVKFGKICPSCGSENTVLETGNEYNIKEIEAM